MQQALPRRRITRIIVRGAIVAGAAAAAVSGRQPRHKGKRARAVSAKKSARSREKKRAQRDTRVPMRKLSWVSSAGPLVGPSLSARQPRLAHSAAYARKHASCHAAPTLLCAFSGHARGPYSSLRSRAPGPMSLCDTLPGRIVHGALPTGL